MQEKKNDVKKIVIKAITVIFTLISLVLIGYFLFTSLGGESKIVNFLQSWAKNNFYVAAILFVILSPLINIIPGISSMFFISLGNILFNDQTIKGMATAFIIIGLSVLITSSLLFLIGRLAGKRLVEWIIGKKASKEAMYFLTVGGKAALPIVYLLPGFPDDTISMVAGMTDMSFMYNFICSLIFRLIGVLVLTVFGSDFIPFDKFTPLIWFLAIVGLLIIGSLLVFISFRYYQYLRKKSEGVKYYLIKGLKLKSRH
ncbi:MAG: VTT domain-containing protein [Bacilli bacterium]